MKNEEKSGGREDEMEQKEQTCENSVEQNMAEMKCEEQDYSLGDEKEWFDTYESMKNMLKRPMQLMQLKFTVMVAGTQMISRTS